LSLQRRLERARVRPTRPVQLDRRYRRRVPDFPKLLRRGGAPALGWRSARGRRRGGAFGQLQLDAPSSFSSRFSCVTCGHGLRSDVPSGFVTFACRGARGRKKVEKFNLLRSRPRRQLRIKSAVAADFSGRTSHFDRKWTPTPFVASIDDSFLFSCLDVELRCLWDGQSSGRSKLGRADRRIFEPGSCPRRRGFVVGGAAISARPN